MQGSSAGLILRISTDLVIPCAIGPYLFDQNAAPVIEQDAGNWMLDTGLKRYSVNLKIEKEQHAAQAPTL